MTIFSNSIFSTVNKYIKFNNNTLNVVNGANTLASLPLCSVKQNYDNYQKLNIIIPKNTTDFLLDLSILGTKPTFISILPKYCQCNFNYNFLKWGFVNSNDGKRSMTTIMVLTGTTTSPIQNILFDNFDTENEVTLDIIVGGQIDDNFIDTLPGFYYNNLLYTSVSTVSPGVFGIYDVANNDLLTSFDYTDITDITKTVGLNQIIIALNNTYVTLNFATEFDTLQALSAINWIMFDPLNRSLPKATDTTAPVITYTVDVIANAINITLTDYTADTFTKQDFITYSIDSVTDDTDDVITIGISNIVFTNNLNQVIPNIVNAGTYNAIITISDIAGNIATETITVTAV